MTTLADFLASVGVPFSRGASMKVEAAMFGERYEIVTTVGVTYDIPDLESAIAITCAEIGNREIAPFLSIQRGKIIWGAPTDNRPGHPTTEQAFGGLTMADWLFREVTMFNLTGQWSDAVFNYRSVW